MTTEQMNEVIAQFDGFEKIKDHPFAAWEKEKHGIRIPNYDNDWNQLMPVIEKISKWPLLNSDGTPCTDSNDTCYPVTFNMPDPNEEGKVMFRFKGHTLHFGEKLIDVCFHAVYDAIQFYNEQTTQP